MGNETKEQRIKKLERKIKILEKTIATYEDTLEILGIRNKELTDAEEGTFLHSPTYVQMCEKIEFMAAVKKLNEFEISELKRKIQQQRKQLNEATKL